MRIRLARRSKDSRDRARQCGAVIVEQAFILPLMLALLFGVIDMSRALYAYHYVGYMAREATRWASVRSGTLNAPQANQGTVQQFVKNVAGQGLDTSKISATAVWISPPNQTPLCPGGLVDSPLNNKPGCIVQVTVNYDFRFMVPLIPSGGFTMSSKSEMTITQ